MASSSSRSQRPITYADLPTGVILAAKNYVRGILFNADDPLDEDLAAKNIACAVLNAAGVAEMHEALQRIAFHEPQEDERAEAMRKIARDVLESARVR